MTVLPFALFYNGLAAIKTWESRGLTFQDVLTQVIHWLQQDKRVSYRALKRQFALDDAYLEDVKFELIEVRQLATDLHNTILVWREASGEAERRQLTVMFCDLVGSTALASRLDPEEWREVIRSFQATCATVIHRFDGYIAQYLGDGLLVYFGYPQAHEHDAERAVRSSLDLLTVMAALNERLAGKNVYLAVRLGIHTGPVVVGAMGGQGRSESLAIGETPNVAARIQELAEPDTILVSADTYRLIQGYFHCQALGVQTLRGVASPMMLYQVQRAHSTRSRVDIAVGQGLTPLVGREPEMALLHERWEQAKAGLGHMIVLDGEAGIGKSRLIHMLTAQVSREGATLLTFRCSPYRTNSALHPVIEHLEHWLQFRQHDTAETKLAKLEHMLQAYHLPQEEAVPLFAVLLSLPHPPHYPALSLSPQKQRQQTHAMLVAWLVETAARQPVLTVWEDVQWADPSTLEFLSLTFERLPMVRLLALLTCRPEAPESWLQGPHATRISLGRFSTTQVETMIAHLTSGKALPPAVRDQIVARTDGIPLFVEEVTKTVLESSMLREETDHYALTGSALALAVPSSLQDALMARLDRLLTAKGVAQIGAVIGRRFVYGLLQAVTQLDDTTLQRELTRLVEADILYQQGIPPEATYMFKHRLIQEAARQALLNRTRQQYHQRIAEALQSQFPDICASQPEVVARHFTAAGLLEPALDYWYKAGQHALSQSAHREALAHVHRGLEVLEPLPDTPLRARHELTLQTTLGQALVAIQGYGAAEVAQAYTRALALCRQVGEPGQFFPVQGGLWQFYAVRAEYDTARELAEHLFTLAQEAHDTALLLSAHTALGQTFHLLGMFEQARQHLEEGLAVARPQQPHALASLLGGEDPGLACQGFTAWTLWMLGYPTQALQRMGTTLALAQQLASPFHLAWALRGAAWLHQLRGERSAVTTHAEALLTLAQEQNFPYWTAMGTLFRGWAVAQTAADTEGIQQLHEGLSILRSTGAELGRPHFLALLADAYGHVAQPEQGLQVLSEALELAEKSGECYYQAELYRLQGELLLAVSPRYDTEAMHCFTQALHIARQQQAKAWELRAALSLSRHWWAQGKSVEAHQALAEVYGWFREGFGMADLQEARAFLAVLDSRHDP